MSSLVRQPLSYATDATAAWLQQLSGAPHRVLLDSSKPYGERGRYDIISADPKKVIHLNTNRYKTYLELTEGINQQIQGAINGFESCADLPFCGGVIGLLDYESGESLALGRQAHSSTSHFLGVYDWAIVVDHARQTAEVVMQSDCSSPWPERIRNQWQATPDLAPFSLSSQFSCSLEKADYEAAFHRLQDYIRAGDCYQVNLTREFSARFTGDPLDAYLQLREVAAAPYSGFLDTGGAQLLCLSPERFLSAKDGNLRTEPIKGTAGRSSDPETDLKLATDLLSSTKNRAENVMIVDLLRNDLGKCCLTGSISAEPLLELQSFRTVHHLVSTVTGQLKPGTLPFEALLSCFPGGSITGAPKRRAMEIIAELEPHRRSAYCGSLFYLSANGRMDSNIVIRSFVCEGDTIRGWAGGGIVADSLCDEEFAETEAKIGRLLDVLRTMRK